MTTLNLFECLILCMIVGLISSAISIAVLLDCTDLKISLNKLKERLLPSKFKYINIHPIANLVFIVENEDKFENIFMVECCKNLITRFFENFDNLLVKKVEVEVYTGIASVKLFSMIDNGYFEIIINAQILCNNLKTDKVGIEYNSKLTTSINLDVSCIDYLDRIIKNTFSFYEIKRKDFYINQIKEKFGHPN